MENTAVLLHTVFFLSVLMLKEVSSSHPHLKRADIAGVRVQMIRRSRKGGVAVTGFRVANMTTPPPPPTLCLSYSSVQYFACSTAGVMRRTKEGRYQRDCLVSLTKPANGHANAPPVPATSYNTLTESWDNLADRRGFPPPAKQGHFPGSGDGVNPPVQHGNDVRHGPAEGTLEAGTRRRDCSRPRVFPALLQMTLRWLPVGGAFVARPCRSSERLVKIPVVKNCRNAASDRRRVGRNQGVHLLGVLKMLPTHPQSCMYFSN